MKFHAVVLSVAALVASAVSASEERTHRLRTRESVLPAPQVIEKTVYVDRVVEKPVYVEKIVEKPVEVEKIVEKPVYVEKIVYRDRPVTSKVAGQRQMMRRPAK